MSTRVGTKGQVVIEKAIRDELGIEPGWVATQRVVGRDRVELRLFPAEHDQPLRGILAEHVERSLAPERFDEIRRAAWARAGARSEQDS